MSSFPALAPTSRVYTPGDIPIGLQTSLTGVSTGFRRGGRRIAQRLELVFSHLTQAQMNLIKDHFFDRNGTFDIFFLSSEIWGDYTGSPPVGLLDNFAWRYIQTPRVADVSFDRFTIQVSLETVPIDTGDLIIDGGAAAATPARTYVLDAGAASALPARTYVINPRGAQ